MPFDQGQAEKVAGGVSEKTMHPKPVYPRDLLLPEVDLRADRGRTLTGTVGADGKGEEDLEAAGAGLGHEFRESERGVAVSKLHAFAVSCLTIVWFTCFLRLVWCTRPRPAPHS